MNSLANIIVVGSELYLLYLIFNGTDFMTLLKEMVVNYMHGSFQAYLFFITSGVITPILLLKKYTM